MKKWIYVVGIIFVLWLMASLFEVWTHSLDNGYQYHKANACLLMAAHTTDMVVIDCQGKYDDTYVVTVQDIKGNQFDYYDDKAKETGTIMRVWLSGNIILDAYIR